jgi:hypothetical protein
MVDSGTLYSLSITVYFCYNANQAENTMKEYSYSLPVTEEARRLATGWLILSIGSLVIAGIFSILVVLSRTPFIQDFFPLIDLFHTALVLHVDFSIIIFFFAFACVFFSLTHQGSNLSYKRLGLLALGLSATGASITALSPLMGAPDPLMNNYLPVLENNGFFAGLALFITGFSLMCINTLINRPFSRSVEPVNPQRSGVYLASILGLTAVASFVWSYLGLPTALQGAERYELLFWGGGHVLQFMYAMLMLVSWLCLSSLISRVSLSPAKVSLIFGIYLLPVFVAPIIHLLFPINSYNYYRAFTLLMEYGMGLPPILIGFSILRRIFKEKTPPDMRHLRAIVIISMMLFAAGGLLGYLIHGINLRTPSHFHGVIEDINLKIPAHYHGVTGAVSLSFMGFTYYLLPKLGFGRLLSIVRFQPYIYGAGQLLYIIGLASAGFLNVQRKVAGSAQGLNTFGKTLSMGIMGIGGMISIIGGVAFLVVVIYAMTYGKTSKG